MARNPRGKNNQRRTTSRAKKPVTIDLDAKDVKVTPTAQARSAASTSVPKMGAKTAAKPSAAKVETPTSKTAARATASKPSTSNKSTNASAKPSPAPKPANKNDSFGKMAAAGLIGGVISLAGASALQNAGVLPSSGPAPTQQSSSTQSVDLTPLQEKIAQLQSQIDKMGSATPAAAPTVDLKPIERRIATLENAPKPQASSSTSTSAGPSAQTTKQLGELQSGLGGLQASTKKLETGLQALSTSSEGTAAKIKSIETAMADDSGTNDLISTAIESAIAPLALSSGKNTQQYGALEKQFAALNKRIDVDVNERINKFDEKLKSAATGEKLARSVAIAALKSALAKGEPFSSSLNSLETLSGTSKPIEGLRPYALTGVATGKSLLDDFRGLQSQMLLAANNKADAGITDRLMSSISALVTVSSDQPLSGASPKAVISRVEANLKTKNFGAAVSEWKTLPEPARNISSTWVNKVNQRIDANGQLFKLTELFKANG